MCAAIGMLSSASNRSTLLFTSASVADGYGRTHDHENLFLAGSNLFPTTGTANPTLTIAAVALRTASKVAEELGLTIPATPVASPIASPAA